MTILDQFPTHLADIYKRLAEIDPVNYARTRNYADGAVTRLSPYLSRGVLSTRQVVRSLLDREIPPVRMEKILQELAWRDYWQQVWMDVRDGIDTDLNHSQDAATADVMPSALLEASTGIKAIDEAVLTLYSTGYMHNHLRMYVAMLSCNLANCHWLTPARWMYYHLLDADWGSNALNWQWVAGTYISKKYIANQENINRFCGTHQRGTFLDFEYENLRFNPIPDILLDVQPPDLPIQLPARAEAGPDYTPGKPACLYTIYNLDPEWRKEIDATRVLILEPSFFNRYPMSAQSIRFIRRLSANITGLQVYTGEFGDWMEEYHPAEVYFKEHPTNRHFKGIEDRREFAFRTDRAARTFSSFWQEARRSSLLLA